MPESHRNPLLFKLSDEDKTDLLNCADATAYSKIAREIKAAHGGHYPDDWYEVVLAPGGVADQLRKKWNDPNFLTIKATTL
jgi:hypothetical protein